MYSDSNIAIVDLFAALVAGMRTIVPITAIDVDIDDATLFKITANNTIKEKEPIDIAGVDYMPINVSSTEFYVRVPSGALDAAYFTEKKPYFEHGHFLEIANKLAEKDTMTELYKYQKYPLIALIQDFPERRSEIKQTEATVTILIINTTEQTYDSRDRYKINFKPVLYPLYDSLLQALRDSNSIGGTFEHTKYDRVAWGTQLAQYNEKVILNDFLDAVELQDLQIQIINSPC